MVIQSKLTLYVDVYVVSQTTMPTFCVILVDFRGNINNFIVVDGTKRSSLNIMPLHSERLCTNYFADGKFVLLWLH